MIDSVKVYLYDDDGINISDSFRQFQKGFVNFRSRPQ